MTRARLMELLAWPALIVGMLGALSYLLTLMGTGKRLDGHVVAESTYHRQTTVIDSSYRRRQDSAVIELHGHTVDQERLLEALVRGECLENSKENLARQGLAAKCRALGIVP